MKISVAKSAGSAALDEHIDGVRVGKIVDIDENGQVWVDYEGSASGPKRARFTGKMEAKTLYRAALMNQNVLLVFEDHDPALPIVVDTVHSSLEETVETAPVFLDTDKQQDIEVDGERVTFDAKEQITLRCGKASITLTRAGKILIRGAYILSRSSGVNRIKGGSVQIN